MPAALSSASSELEDTLTFRIVGPIGVGLSVGVDVFVGCDVLVGVRLGIGVYEFVGSGVLVVVPLGVDVFVGSDVLVGVVLGVSVGVLVEVVMGVGVLFVATPYSTCNRGAAAGAPSYALAVR